MVRTRKSGEMVEMNVSKEARRCYKELLSLIPNAYCVPNTVDINLVVLTNRSGTQQFRCWIDFTASIFAPSYNTVSSTWVHCLTTPPNALITSMLKCNVVSLCGIPQGLLHGPDLKIIIS